MKETALVQDVAKEANQALTELAVDKKTRIAFASIATTVDNLATSERFVKMMQGPLLTILSNRRKRNCLIRLLSIARKENPELDDTMHTVILNFASFLVVVQEVIKSDKGWSPELLAAFRRLQLEILRQAPAFQNIMDLCKPGADISQANVVQKVMAFNKTSLAVVQEMKRFEWWARKQGRVATKLGTGALFTDAALMFLKLLGMLVHVYAFAYQAFAPVVWAGVWASIHDFLKPVGWMRIFVDAVFKPELAADLPGLPGTRAPGALYSIVQTIDSVLRNENSPLLWMVDSASNLVKSTGIVDIILNQVVALTGNSVVVEYLVSPLKTYLAYYLVKLFFRFLGKFAFYKLFTLGREKLMNLLFGPGKTLQQRDIIGYQCVQGLCKPLYEGEVFDSRADVFATLHACRRFCKVRGGYSSTYFGVV
jgi:hypothetical protein